MKVQIVSYEDPDKWILGKFARKMNEQLLALEVDAHLGREPDPGADVNHHICYVNYDGFSEGINTLMVTHVDSVGLLRKLRNQLESADLAICMSSHTMHDLEGAGLPSHKLCFVSPAHDGVFTPRPLRIGIMTRLYDDGRKNEEAFSNLLESLPRTSLHFVIMGQGWQPVVERMKELDFSAEYYAEFDLDTYRRLMPSLDYFTYFGHDEGSMGFIDAVAAGVKTIVTPQGYHMDVRDGITHTINNLDDLAAVLIDIVEKRRRRAAGVADWTWRRYAEKHLELWKHLSGTPSPRSSTDKPKTMNPNADGLASLESGFGSSLKSRFGFLLNLVRNSVSRRLRSQRN